MCAPILFWTKCCGGKIEMAKNDKAPKKLGDKCYFIAPTIDAVVSITCLVMGMLGILGTVAMPPAAAYSLIAVSGVISLAWIAFLIQAACAGKGKKN